jgi:5-hydroxyisourate hydrolase-like protein (transthyretin family)
VNNIYTGWEKYAIGGSADPTINSQGNVFMALDNSDTKEASFSISFHLRAYFFYPSKGKGNSSFFTNEAITEVEFEMKKKASVKSLTLRLSQLNIVVQLTRLRPVR